MTKQITRKHTLLFLLSGALSLLFSMKAFLHFYPGIATQPERFDDFIIETLASTGTNKTGELKLFYWILILFVFLFVVIYSACYYIFIHSGHLNDQSHQDLSSNSIKEVPMDTLCKILLCTCIPNLCRLIVFGNISYPLLFLSMMSILAYILFKDSVVEVTLLFLLIYYTTTGIATALCVTGMIQDVSSNMLYVTTIVLCAILLVIYKIWKNKRFLQYTLVFSQFFLPFLLFIYFVDEYMYQGSLITIPYAKGYTCFFILFIIVCYVYLISHTRTYLIRDMHLKNAKDLTLLPLKSALCRNTPIILFVYNSFSAAPMYAQPDQHHHGEQMIPWQQVVTLGRSLYEEYTPVSGLFPFFFGGIQNLLLDGTVSDYSPAISIGMVIFCILTMYLITKHVGTLWGIVFSVLFSLPCYNRQYFVLPLLLLLFLPKLLRKRNLWLKVWLLSCFIAGLYYPLFGGAVVVGTLPLLVNQFYHFILEIKGNMLWKKAHFYVNWGLCLLPILVSIPLLLHMLKHTLTYSSQTILADGISLWGQTPPSTFMTYLSNVAYWDIFYLCLRFALPMIGVAIFIFLLNNVLINKGFKKGFGKNDSSVHPFFFLTAGAISLLVSYSYTLVRADTGMILSRTSYILVAIVGMYLPVMLLTYGKNYFSTSLRFVLIGFCFALPMMIYYQTSDMKRPDMWIYPNGDSALFLDDGKKVYSYYQVPDNFIRSSDTDLSEKQKAILGPGFMVDDQLHYLKEYETVMEKCQTINSGQTYLGLDGQGFYYYTDSKACGTGFIQAAKGFDAQTSLLRIIAKERPVVFLLEAKSNYYIYHYIMTHDYVYMKEDDALYPQELYQKLYPDRTPDDYRDTCDTTDFGLVAASFGKSFDSLRARLTPMESNDNSSNFIPFNGADYDCMEVILQEGIEHTIDSIYVHFTIDNRSSDDDKTTNTERSSCRISCKVDGNHLLIPMGMDPCWINSTITSISITGTNADGEEIPFSEEQIQYHMYRITQPNLGAE